MPIKSFLSRRGSAHASAQRERPRLLGRRSKTHIASRVVIRKPVSWRSRVLWTILLAALAAAAGYGLFTAGQLTAGYSSREAAARIDALEAENADLRARNASLAEKVENALTQLGIAQGARQSLEGQVGRLEEERGRLTQDLALFENLFPASGAEGVPAIRGFRVERVGTTTPATWRYRVLVTRGGQSKDEFAGDFRLQVRYRRDNRESLAEGPEAGSVAAPLRFQRYQRIEGQFRSPPGAILLGAVARVEENGKLVSESVFRNP